MNINPISCKQYYDVIKRREEEEARWQMMNLAYEKLQMKNDAALELLYRKGQMKKEDEENARAMYEEVAVMDDGRVTVVTRNAQVQAQPRIVSNMRNPSLFIVAKKSDFSDFIFVLNFEINQKSRQVFLDPKKFGSPTYVLNKFTASGIEIIASSSAKEKAYVRSLMSLLVRDPIITSVPDEPGWIEKEPGKFRYIERGGMTWKTISRLI